MADRPNMEAVRIGALAPLGRPGWVDAGQQLLAGLELGVDDINDAGGIDGRPIKLEVRDTASSPSKASAAAEDLAAQGVVALLGEYHSVAARAIAAKADALSVPFLCSSAVIDSLIDRPSPWVARVAPPQSRGWNLFAEYLVDSGHRRIALATQPSVYWGAGARVLRSAFDRLGGTVVEIGVQDVDARAVHDWVASTGATALLLLVGYPEPTIPIVHAIRRDRRLADLLIGAPAGQPELTGWSKALGDLGAGVPFLRYLPETLTDLGNSIERRLHKRLGRLPSFVAFEGYDSIQVLGSALRNHGTDRSAIAACWSAVVFEGTRGQVRLSRQAGECIHQWRGAPIEVAEIDPFGQVMRRRSSVQHASTVR